MATSDRQGPAVIIGCWWWARMAAAFTLLFSSSAASGLPPYVQDFEKRVLEREGNIVKLTCPITSSPLPLYDWKKDDDDVEESWTRFTIRKNTLRIKDVAVDDSGTYVCKGVNGFGQATATIQLIVLDRSLVPSSGDFHVESPAVEEVVPSSEKGPLQRKRGEKISLRCRVTGFPPPTVLWFKDGTSLDYPGAKLQLDHLTVGDSGVYTCIATSLVGEASANFSLHVTDGVELEVSDPVNTTVIEGGSTSLQCTVSTVHMPTIQWLKEVDEDTASRSGHNSSLEIQKRWFQRVEGPEAGAVVSTDRNTYLSKLTFHHAVRSQEGVYACLAMNNLGYAFKLAHLTVIHQEYPNDRAVGMAQRGVNWLFLIIPGLAVIVIIVGVLICRMRRVRPEKPSSGVPPPLPSGKGGEEPSSMAPLNPGSDPNNSYVRPSDLVYQNAGGYLPGGHYQEKYPSPYPATNETYPDHSYSDPYSERGPPRSTADQYSDYRVPHRTSEHYCDPRGTPASDQYSDLRGTTRTSDQYSDLRVPTRASDQYSDLRVPTRSSDHSYARLTHASSSPHPPPPSYAHLPSATTHIHSHRHPQYFVHYNL